ncbi:hypothetical protein T484DRAFT_1778849, partial [Baffinella frigidus]
MGGSARSHEGASGRGDAACGAETGRDCPEDVAVAGGHAGRQQRRAALRGAAGWLALLVVAGCIAHGCVATGVSESMLEPVPPMDELPAELLEELAMLEGGHPMMRRLLAVDAANATNATNVTNATVEPFFMANVGTTYACVAKSEYTAIAQDITLRGVSRQYTDGNFFCEDITLRGVSRQNTDGTFFCKNYTDYAAACDLNDPKR